MDKRTCSVEGCNNPSRSKGFCPGHYQQNRKGQELRPLKPSSRGLTIEQRLWSKVSKGTGCWEWTGYVMPQGYGLFWDGKKPSTAHRVSWELTNGPIPDGKDLDHRCANRKCVNPEHLRVTTRSQNNQHRTGPARNNTSGVRGVTWDKSRNAWAVSANLNGRYYWGGRHSTIEDAERAARALRAKLHTHDDHDEWVKTQTAPPVNDGAA